MTDHAIIPASVNRTEVIYAPDTIVRDAAIETIYRITEKVHRKAHNAVYGASTEDEQRRKMDEALEYAVSALRGIHTALSLGRGGYVGVDDTTSLFFCGIMTGAVIDRDTSFSSHT